MSGRHFHLHTVELIIPFPAIVPCAALSGAAPRRAREVTSWKSLAAQAKLHVLNFGPKSVRVHNSGSLITVVGRLVSKA